MSELISLHFLRAGDSRPRGLLQGSEVILEVILLVHSFFHRLPLWETEQLLRSGAGSHIFYNKERVKWRKQNTELSEWASM